MTTAGLRILGGVLSTVLCISLQAPQGPRGAAVAPVAAPVTGSKALPAAPRPRRERTRARGGREVRECPQPAGV
jgi:hypothetical protein